MEKIKPHQPAFPTSDKRNRDNDLVYSAEPGMSKREYFAAMAMQGLLYQNLPVDRALNEKNNSQVNGIAEASVKMADALIEQLNKNQ